MCRVLAYLGPEIPIQSLLLEPENSLLNQSLDPELHSLLQLAGWGFGCWSDSFVKPEAPLRYRRPMAAFYDDNAEGVIPSLRASTLVAHVRAAAYDAGTVLTDENCHPFSFEATPWMMAHNGVVPHWKVLQRELLPHCEDRYLEQMRGTTDTEFLFALLVSLLEGNSDDDVKVAFETLMKLILSAMKKLDVVGLTKLKIALAAQNRIIGVNVGSGHQGETDMTADWRELRKAEAGTKDHDLSMVLEPMYLLTGRNFLDHEASYRVDPAPADEATSAIFASEPLTEETDDWMEIEFGQLVAIERVGDGLQQTLSQLDL